MKQLNQQATKVFNILVEGMKRPGDGKKIDNADGAFMAVHVDFIHANEHGQHFAIAHHYLQHGDVMNDPEMVFLLATADNQVYPLTFRQDGGLPINQVAATADDGESIRSNQKLQDDLVSFANMWMKNIKEQQGLKTERG